MSNVGEVGAAFSLPLCNALAVAVVDRSMERAELLPLGAVAAAAVFFLRTFLVRVLEVGIKLGAVDFEMARFLAYVASFCAAVC